MTSAPPKAIKAFVTGVIKDQILESSDFAASSANNNNNKNAATIPVLALLRMELVQRGVLLSIKDDTPDTWDARKTLEAVRNSAGKAILQEGGSLPTPLLAASAVMAGRVAELCASLTHDNSDDSNTPSVDLTTVLDQEAVQSALERCKDVSDPRFQVLLELLLATPKEQDATTNRTAFVHLSLLQIAEGYYLRGAQFTPDTPQMWKKAYDVILAHHSSSNTATTKDSVSPGDAAVVLGHMARIAASKGNAKRATELRVRAVESYLQLAATTTNNGENTTTTSSNNTDTTPQVEQVFVCPYKTPIQNPLDEAQSALEACQEHKDLLSPEEVFIVCVLDAKVQLAQESLQLENESQHALQQAQNRAAEPKPVKGKAAGTMTTGKQAPSLAVLRQTTRRQILVQGGHLEDASAVLLRDATLERLGNTTTTTNSEEDVSKRITSSAASTLTQVLERYRDQAKALSCQKTSSQAGWASLRDYLTPFLKFTQSVAAASISDGGGDAAETIQTWLNTLSAQALALVETYVTLVPCVEWMSCSTSTKPKDDTLPQEYLPLVKHTLVVLVGRAVQAKKKYQASSNVLKTSTEPLDVKIRQLECARASIQSLILMRQVGDSVAAKKNSANDRKVLSELAVSMAQRADKYKGSSLEYGTGFWNFVLAWSGFQQSPWSFCTAPEARSILKHATQCITQAKKDWGRSISEVEQLLLELGQADAECGILSGGLPSIATKSYRDVLERATTMEVTDSFRSLVKSHCWIGLTRLELFGNSKAAEDSDASELAQKSLEELATIAMDQEIPAAYYLWTSPNAVVSFVKFHMTASRQLVADALVRSGRASEAKQFLEDAVRDSPTDAEAAFSLGAFLLRDAFQCTERSPAELNDAKMQLLKAARLDSRKAGPFALLGVWYEDQGDRKRALGCYSKALLLDPPHPVAGRGVVRQTSWGASKAVIDAAVKTSSAVNGWAWRALGKHKVMVTGENDLGAVALLKALRCRDIDQPQNESLSAFFSIHSSSSKNSNAQYLSREKAESWSELAFCYRRLGRYTAAIRGYYSSIEASGEHVTASVLCACAEAELGLGLAEEAAEKFRRALEISGPATKPIAAYGQGSSLLSLAQRDAQDGKAGAAYGYVQQAMEGFEGVTTSFGCTQKLLGDLYSFGATLPPDIFSYPASKSDVENQIAFVQKGEACYKSAVEFYASVSDNADESNLLCAAVITDAGANVLLRAQLTAYSRCKGFGYASMSASSIAPDISELYECASAEFRRAAELCPDYGPAWCGLGCSMVFSDPLLAQHSFCRSIQLDSLAPDAYANLGFLYTSHKSFDASNGVLDALTQVADSPMMWINRALILERSAADDLVAGNGGKAAESISQAADAYRAALQVVKHPSAMLGLALTCRVSSSTSNSKGGNLWESQQARASFQESYGYMLEHEGSMGRSDVSASIVESLASLEKAAYGYSAESENLVSDGKKAVVEKLEALKSFQQDSLEDGTSGLDLDLIQKALSADGLLPGEEEEEKVATGFAPPPSMTLARQITFEPHRGDLWVELAKQLFADSSAQGESKSALASAHLAASRAKKILTHQLTFPNQTGSRGSPWVVDQRDLAEALALEYWLESLLLPITNEDQGEEKEAEEETSDTVEETSDTVECGALDLQKSLMICPNNRFARAALAATSS